MSEKPQADAADPAVVDAVSLKKPGSETLVKMKSTAFLFVLGFLCWFTGYFGFSVFLIIPVVFLFWKYQSHVNEAIMERDRYEYIRHMALERQHAETMDWFNTFIAKVWFNGYREWSDTVRQKITDQLENKPPPIPGEIRVEEFTLGSQPPIFESIQCGNLPSKNKYMLDMTMNISLNLNLLLSISVGKIRGLPNIPLMISLSDLDFVGTLRLNIDLIETNPYISKVHISFKSLPRVDFKLKPLAKIPVNIISLPGLRDFLMGEISDGISDNMMGDNKITVDVAAMTKPEENTSKAILVVELMGAENLVAKDIGGRSDPYATITCGPSTHKTSIHKKTVNPVWNQKYNFLVKNKNVDKLIINVFDFDRGSAHDSLGSFTLLLRDLEHGDKREMSERLQGVKKGKVNFKIQYLDMERHRKSVASKEEAKNDEVVDGDDTFKDASDESAARPVSMKDKAKNLGKAIGEKLHKKDDGPEVTTEDIVKTHGMLYVRLVACKDLIAKDIGGKSDPYVKFEMGQQKFKSDTIKRNLNPKWLDRPTFEFMVDDPETDVLNVKVFDWDKLGSHDRLGGVMVRFSEADMKSFPAVGEFRDVKLPLEGVKSGTIHLQLNYVPF